MSVYFHPFNLHQSHILDLWRHMITAQSSHSWVLHGWCIKTYIPVTALMWQPAAGIIHYSSTLDQEGSVASTAN